MQALIAIVSSFGSRLNVEQYSNMILPYANTILSSELATAHPVYSTCPSFKGNRTIFQSHFWDHLSFGHACALLLVIIPR